jgi:hypothetical protein
MQPPRPKPKRHVAFLIATGAAYREVYNINTTGSETTFEVGLWQPSWSVYGMVNAFFGGTGGGLFMSHIRFGSLIEGGTPRLRFGGGPQIGFMFVPRATYGDTLFGITLGLTTHARADLVVWEERAIFLEARSSMGYNPVMFTAEGYVGIRL